MNQGLHWVNIYPLQQPHFARETPWVIGGMDEGETRMDLFSKPFIISACAQLMKK
jgi:hypothetical protein